MGQCVSFVVAFHHYFHVLFLKTLMVIISGDNTNNISFLNHAQHWQRFFTFMTSPEALGNKGSVWNHAHFRDKNPKGQKRWQESQVTELRRGQDGTRPQMLCFHVQGSSHTHGSHYIGLVCNSSNTSQLWSRSRGEVKYPAPRKFGGCFHHDVISMKGATPMLLVGGREGAHTGPHNTLQCFHSPDQWLLNWSHW